LVSVAKIHGAPKWRFCSHFVGPTAIEKSWRVRIVNVFIEWHGAQLLFAYAFYVRHMLSFRCGHQQFTSLYLLVKAEEPPGPKAQEVRRGLPYSGPRLSKKKQSVK
jgi:hypothetical protein